MTDGYITGHEVPIYYRRFGAGSKPLVFLHGNGEDGLLFYKVAERFATEDFSVYLPDSRCHGKSGCGVLDYGRMAEDMYRLISALQLEKPAAYGFSDGGIVTLLLAMRHPQLLSRLAVSGVNLNPRALTRAFRFAVRLGYFFTRDPKYKLMLTQPDIRPEELEAVQISALVIAGQKDIIPASHTNLIAESLPNARSRILQGENHFSYVADNDKLYGILSNFFHTAHT